MCRNDTCESLAGLLLFMQPARHWSKYLVQPFLEAVDHRPGEERSFRPVTPKLWFCVLRWRRELSVAVYGAPLVRLSSLRRTCSSSDASGDPALGWGLIAEGVLHAQGWRALARMPRSTAAAELCPIVAYVVCFGERLRHSLFTATTDSEAAFYAMCSGSSAELEVFELLALLSQAQERWDVRVLAEWIPRSLNYEPDMLSKGRHPAQQLARPLPVLPLPSLSFPCRPRAFGSA